MQACGDTADQKFAEDLFQKISVRFFSDLAQPLSSFCKTESLWMDKLNLKQNRHKFCFILYEKYYDL